ncbi:GNAT family N-acetyltransferase [Geodermatophilus sp. FMUSA9-8]|uniref:GNAT family N-acetyltransferase n=1 Tax=Geodermatophilus sp. FMUSA9-8 TaxID=3120155 RepID=UPI00300935F1
MRAPDELPAGPLLLRPWRAGDLDAVWSAMQDPALRAWSATPLDGSRATAEEWLARRLDVGDRRFVPWAVADAADGGLLGSVALHSVDLEQGDAEVGYWTVPAARGRGLAARAVDAAVRWGFAALPVDRVELVHAVDNPASGRVAAKAGFTLEGRLRRSFRYADGVKHDELLWARLADDAAPDLSTRS